MHITKYIIRTMYGNKYEVDANGYVLTYSNGLDKRNATIDELKTWQIIGISEIKPFNQLGRLIPLDEVKKITNWQFKNGKPKYTIHDIDHGTHRIVGNWNIHGIKSVEVL